MRIWKNFKQSIWKWMLDNIKSYHFIIVGLALSVLGIYNIIKIKNSEWYSGRIVVFGIFLFISGIYVFWGEIKNPRNPRR
jgi:uncharacterized membrane protein